MNMFRKNNLILISAFLLMGYVDHSIVYAFMPVVFSQKQNSTVLRGISKDNSGIKKLDESEAWSKFKESYGEGWQVNWNKDTGIPHRVFGDKKPLLQKGLKGPLKMRDSERSLTEIDFEEISRNFISENKDLFKINEKDLYLQRDKRHGSVFYVTYKQYFQDIPVYTSQVNFQFDAEGNLLLFGADVYPDISVSILPAVEKEKAVQIAKDNTDFNEEQDKISGPKLLIYPEENKDGFSYYLAWELRVNIKDPKGSWIYFIDAGNGNIIRKYNNIKYDINGKTKGFVLPRYYNDTPEEVAFPYESVLINAESAVVYYEWKFDSSPDWSTEGGWMFDSLNGTGGGDPAGANTGEYIYGYNINGRYENNMGTTMYLTTTPIDCSNIKGTALKFYRNLTIENLNDSASIEVSNNGLNWTVIWSSKNEVVYYQNLEWKLKSYDISDIADGYSSVYIRWGMGPTNGSIAEGGWNIDDVQITDGYSKTSSNKDGDYSFTTDPGSYSLLCDLTGKYLKVENKQSEKAYFSTSVEDGDSADVIWDTGLTSLGGYDEMNVYYHSMRMRDYIISIDSAYTGMNYCVPAVVQINDIIDINNAYWESGAGMGFGAGDGVNYRSFALASDIIYHEYTHGVTDKLYEEEGGELIYQDGTESGAMSEGFSDYWACTLTGDSVVGKGVRLDGVPLRDLNNVYVYPDNWRGKVHNDGLIISGAMWRMRKALGRDIVDRLFHFARYGIPDKFEDFLIEVLRLDDDNNNLEDGTPHAAVIYSSFGSSGISGLRLKSVSINDKDVGNGNGKINPGERVKLAISLENNMWQDMSGVKGNLFISDNYIKVLSTEINFSGMKKRGGIADNSLNQFEISIENSVPVNHKFSFTLAVTTQQDYTFNLPFTLLVSATVYNEPVNIAPLDNSINSLDVELSWAIAFEAGDVLTYDIYLDTAGAFTKIAENISTNNYKLNNLEYGKSYFWKVIAHSKYGAQTKELVNRFRTVIAGDVDKNGIVDGNDLAEFAIGFGMTKGFVQYIDRKISDIDRNNRIDGADLMSLGMNFGKSY